MESFWSPSGATPQVHFLDFGLVPRNFAMEAKTAEHKAFKQRQEEVCFLIFGHIGYMEQQKKTGLRVCLWFWRFSFHCESSPYTFSA